jgi:hypothetical protein
VSQVRQRSSVLAAAFAVVGGSAFAGSLIHSSVMSDENAFAAAGRVMFSGSWRHTYADPWLQAGPLELLLTSLGHWLGGTFGGVPIAMNVIGATALMATAIFVLGARWAQVLVVGFGAIGLGIITDMYEIGHPSELFIALAWVLAARSARRGNVVAAGAIVGVSAWFETWGVLGLTVLLLLPTLRGAVNAGAIACAVGAVIYVPFALGGDFHMFHEQWTIAGGVDAIVFGRMHPFTWGMRVTEAAVVCGIGGGLALGIRRWPFSIWVVPAATSLCRIVLDPTRYGYYWDTALVLMLIGIAPWVTTPRLFAAQLRTRLHRSATSDSASGAATQEQALATPRQNPEPIAIL